MAHDLTNAIFYIECGCCGYFHLPDYFGECRDDAQRFDHMQLDAKHGPEGWDYLTVEDQMRAEKSEA